MATCHLCPPDDNTVDDRDILDHLRVIHPDQYGEGPQRWPDGQPVIVDTTLDPADWACGAFQPLPTGTDRMPYRCTEPHDHPDGHRAVLDGQVLAEWASRDET
ncbi:hypothetical protein ACFYUR_21985 [Micromonospora haikouensis]|uniref:hypothetical protein n=1 Tax=Micromonospora haikouensis TaxID=686309 RepID=UPI003689BCDC